MTSEQAEALLQFAANIQWVAHVAAFAVSFLCGTLTWRVMCYAWSRRNIICALLCVTCCSVAIADPPALPDGVVGSSFDWTTDELGTVTFTWGALPVADLSVDFTALDSSGYIGNTGSETILIFRDATGGWSSDASIGGWAGYNGDTQDGDLSIYSFAPWSGTPVDNWVAAIASLGSYSNITIDPTNMPTTWGGNRDGGGEEGNQDINPIGALWSRIGIQPSGTVNAMVSTLGEGIGVAVLAIAAFVSIKLCFPWLGFVGGNEPTEKASKPRGIGKRSPAQFVEQGRLIDEFSEPVKFSDEPFEGEDLSGVQD